MIKNIGLEFCLATEGRIIADMTFVSREDVQRIKDIIGQPFSEVEEIAADDMAQAAYMAIVTLHAAIVNHLVQTALPLPQMLEYQFAGVWPTVVIAYKLYSDANRADQVRDENKIVHPAFCPLQGRALSA
jgi:prophage DNA circulation protein